MGSTWRGMKSARTKPTAGRGASCGFRLGKRFRRLRARGVRWSSAAAETGRCGNWRGFLKRVLRIADNCSGTPSPPLVKGAHRGERDPLRFSYAPSRMLGDVEYQGGRGRHGTVGQPLRRKGLVLRLSGRRALGHPRRYDRRDAARHDGGSRGRFREARRPRKVPGEPPAHRAPSRTSTSSLGRDAHSPGR